MKSRREDACLAARASRPSTYTVAPRSPAPVRKLLVRGTSRLRRHDRTGNGVPSSTTSRSPPAGAEFDRHAQGVAIRPDQSDLSVPFAAVEHPRPVVGHDARARRRQRQPQPRLLRRLAGFEIEPREVCRDAPGSSAPGDPAPVRALCRGAVAQLDNAHAGAAHPREVPLPQEASAKAGALILFGPDEDFAVGAHSRAHQSAVRHAQPILGHQARPLTRPQLLDPFIVTVLEAVQRFAHTASAPSNKLLFTPPTLFKDGLWGSRPDRSGFSAPPGYRPVAKQYSAPRVRT